MSKIDLYLSDDKQIELISTALSSPIRRKIIRLATEGSYSSLEIAQKLDLPASTTSFHLKALKDAGLIKIMPSPANRKNQKIVYQSLSLISFNLKVFHDYHDTTQFFEIPVGSYHNFSVEPSCGMVDSGGLIIDYDQPEAFYSPRRFDAQLIYFHKGYLEYCLPIQDLKNKNITSISILLEICSECPMSNDAWKSDITFWLNDRKLCTYRSLSDYGDRQGKNTPSFWPANATQYGTLKRIRVNHEATYLDEELVSLVSLKDLSFDTSILRFKLGVEDDAKYVGGINIFGRNFGDTDHDILVEITYNSD